MRDVIEKVVWYSIDGCSIEKRLSDYLDGYAKGLKQFAPININK